MSPTIAGTEQTTLAATMGVALRCNREKERERERKESDYAYEEEGDSIVPLSFVEPWDEGEQSEDEKAKGRQQLM